MNVQWRPYIVSLNPISFCCLGPRIIIYTEPLTALMIQNTIQSFLLYIWRAQYCNDVVSTSSMKTTPGNLKKAEIRMSCRNKNEKLHKLISVQEIWIRLYKLWHLDFVFLFYILYPLIIICGAFNSANGTRMLGFSPLSQIKEIPVFNAGSNTSHKRCVKEFKPKRREFLSISLWLGRLACSLARNSSHYK